MRGGRCRSWRFYRQPPGRTEARTSARGIRHGARPSDAERVERALPSDERAAARLYAHCTLMSRMTKSGRSRAQVRLENELGPELAQLLVAALSTNLRRSSS